MAVKVTPLMVVAVVVVVVVSQVTGVRSEEEFGAKIKPGTGKEDQNTHTSDLQQWRGDSDSDPKEANENSGEIELKHGQEAASVGKKIGKNTIPSVVGETKTRNRTRVETQATRTVPRAGCVTQCSQPTTRKAGDKNTAQSTLPARGVLTAPFSTSGAVVRDITTAAPPDTPPTPTLPQEKVAKNTEIRIDTSVFQITTVTPPPNYKLTKGEAKQRITGFAGLTLAPEDTDEGKGKLYKPFTLPAAPSSESWRVNKGTKGKNSHVAGLRESTGGGKQSVRENGVRRSGKRETEAERDTPHYWEYLHDREGSGRVHDSQSISKEVEKELPHRILASTQDIIEKSSLAGKGEAEVKEAPSGRQAVEEEQETDLRPGSSFSYVSFQRFPAKFQSSPGLDSESGGREDTDAPNLPQQPFQQQERHQTFSRTTSRSQHHNSRPSTFGFKTTPNPSRTTRTQIKVPRPSSRPKAISNIKFFQGGLEILEEDSDKQEEHSRGHPVLPLESLLEELEGEEEGRGKEDKEDVFFPTFDNFLREHGISDILKTNSRFSHEDEGDKNKEGPRRGSPGSTSHLKQPQVITDKVRDDEHLTRHNQRPRFSANHRQRFHSQANHNAPSHLSTSQPLVLPFPANQRTPRPSPANQKSPPEISINQGGTRDFSANKKPSQDFLANKEPPRDLSANQRLPRDFLPNKDQHRTSFRLIKEQRQNHHVTPSNAPANHEPKFHPSPKPSDVIGGRDLLPFLKEFPTSTTALPHHQQGQGKKRPSSTSSFSIGSPSGSFKSPPAGGPGPRGPNESFTLSGPPKDIIFKDLGDSTSPFLKSGPPKLLPPQGPLRPHQGPEGHLPVIPQGLNAVEFFPESFPDSQDRPSNVVKLEPHVVLNIPHQGRFEGLPPQDPFRPPSRPRGKRPEGSRGPPPPPPGARLVHHARAPGRNPRIQFSGRPDAIVKNPTGGIRSTRDSQHHLHAPGDFHAPQFIQPPLPRPQGKRNPLANPHGNTVSETRTPEFGPSHGITGEGHSFSPFPQGRDTPPRPPHRAREHSGGHISPHLELELFPPQFNTHNEPHNPLPHHHNPQPHHNHHHGPQPHPNALSPPHHHITIPSLSHPPRPEPQSFPSPHEQKGSQPSDLSQPLPDELSVKMSESHARLLRNMEYGVHGEPLDVWIPITN
ncbi:hypothetical protein O3P69_004725 [Scylla paramamosain]|uniref:Uncharacterized protein n=1 Tax=Scylla paramamosain TaxID=85552 RepID=A0AAW0UGA6_SCYPA